MASPTLSRNIIIVSLTSLLTDVSTEMVYPLLPFFLVTQLGARPATLGLIEGFAESLASLLRVFSGYWSDRLRRRKPLAILGYAASTAGKLALFLAQSWLWVLGGRLADRFGKGVRTAPRDALIAESVAPELRGRGFGFHRAMDTLGATIGVGLAYLLFTRTHGNYRWLFLASLIPAALGVMVLTGVRDVRRSEPPKPPEPLRPLRAWRSLPRRLKLFLLIVFFFTLGNSSNQFLLLRARSLGFSEATVILLYLLYNLVYAAAAYPTGRLSDRVGRRGLLVAGYAAYGLTYLGFAVTPGPGPVWGLFAFYALYMGLTEGVEKALVVDLAPRELWGTMLGLHATLVGIGLLPASLLAGALWDLIGPAAPFYFGGALGLLAALGMWLIAGTPTAPAAK